MNDQTDYLAIHDGMADCLNHMGTFDEQGISDDGTCYIVSDGRLFRVELHLISD